MEKIEKVITVWRASDGTEFDAEFKCSEYERVLNVKMWDLEGCRVKNFNYAYLVKIEAVDQMRLMVRMVKNKTGLPEPKQISLIHEGYWTWDREEKKWRYLPWNFARIMHQAVEDH